MKIWKAQSDYSLSFCFFKKAHETHRSNDKDSVHK